MGEDLVMMAKFSMGIQMEGTEVPTRATMEALTKDIGEECTAP